MSNACCPTPADQTNLRVDGYGRVESDPNRRARPTLQRILTANGRTIAGMVTKKGLKAMRAIHHGCCMYNMQPFNFLMREHTI